MYKKIMIGLAVLATSFGMAALPVFSGQAHAATGAPGMSVVASASPALKRFKTNWPWYITRGSGIVAAILLLLLVLSGVGLLTGYTYKFLEPLPAWAAHRALGLGFGVSVGIHIFFLLFDKYIGFTVADLLIPFRSQYRPISLGNVHVGSLWISLGIFAFYGVLLVIISSLLWMNTKPKPWRALHYLSYMILLFTFLHALFLGTDLKDPLVRFFWFLGGFAIMISIIVRLWRAHTIDRDE